MKKLDEHLSYIYLSEGFSDLLSGIKQKASDFFKAFSTKNVSRMKDSLRGVPEVKNANEIVTLGKNRLPDFDKYYNEGKRYTKGDNSEAKKVLSATYATMKSISQNTDNPQIKNSFDAKIKKFVEYLKDAPEGAIAGGVTFVIASQILKALMEEYKGNDWFKTLLELGQATGFITLALGIILVIIKYILLIYLKIKGIEVKVEDDE